jgi:hypothetical protein
MKGAEPFNLSAPGTGRDHEKKAQEFIDHASTGREFLIHVSISDSEAEGTKEQEGQTGPLLP